MPLSKFPIEVPLGGAVDEGNVPEIVQPPRIREAEECASIKGGAYTKRDAEDSEFASSLTDADAIERIPGATVLSRDTTVEVYPDESEGDSSRGWPAPITGGQTAGYRPTEPDAVKQHGDHATLTLPSGRERTMVAWNEDPSGAYRWTGQSETADVGNETDTQPPQGDEAPNIRSLARWWAYYLVGDARYALFENDRQIGSERPIPIAELTPAQLDEEARGPACFPRIRSFNQAQRFVACTALATPQRNNPASPNDPIPGSWGVHLASYEGYNTSATQPGSVSLAQQRVYYMYRDILDRCHVPQGQGDGAPTGLPMPTDYPFLQRPGGNLVLFDEDGGFLSARRTGANDADLLTPALDMVTVPAAPGDPEEFYTLHVDYGFEWDPSAFPSGALFADANVLNLTRIRRWRVAAGAITHVSQATFDTLADAPPVTGVPGWEGDWPAGLHDLGGNRLLLVMSSTRMVTFDYDLNQQIATQPFWTYAPFPTSTGTLRMCEEGIGRRLLAVPPAIEPYEMRNANGDVFNRACGAFRNGSMGNNNPSTNQHTQRTTQMARAQWAGSFAIPLDNPDNPDEQRIWVGVQGRAEQTPDEQETNPDQVRLPTWPTVSSGTIYCSIVTISASSQSNPSGQEPDGTPVPGVVYSNPSWIIPGASIATRGAQVSALADNFSPSGPVVGIYASSPGDDRTAMQEQYAETSVDLFTSTLCFITLRADNRLPNNPAGYINGFRRPTPCVATVLPYGQSTGTFQVNPYQVRTNLHLTAAGLRGLGFETYAPSRSTGSGDIVFEDRIPKPISSPSRAAPYAVVLSYGGAAQYARAGQYAISAGPTPCSVGGPQALSAGLPIQAAIDSPAYYSWSPPGDTGPKSGMSVTPYVSTYTTEQGTATRHALACQPLRYDESGGEHRAVPFLAQGVPYPLRSSWTADATGASVDDAQFFGAYIYPYPWAIFGIPNSTAVLSEVYSTQQDTGSPPTSCGGIEAPLAGGEPWRAVGLGASPNVWRFGQVSDGSSVALYTWAGELAAGTPDSSLAVASGPDRAWSISADDPYRAQYTKLLRKGYAPEWNGNLSVRVPGTGEPLTAIGVLPDGRVLLFTAHTTYYTYGEGPSDTGQGAGFATPQMLSTTEGARSQQDVYTGTLGCMFRSERGFYLVGRDLTLQYVGLPYEDSTDEGNVLGVTEDALRSEIVWMTDVNPDPVTVPPSLRRRCWVFNTLRQQWSTFNLTGATSTTSRDARPWWYALDGEVRSLSTAPAPATSEPVFERNLMSLATGWLAMGRIQGFGRTWEVQLTGDRTPTSLSGLRVEIYYDYADAPAETYDFDEVGAGQFKVRFRPRKQKSEAISFRFSEYVPPGKEPELCTGWRLDMCTVLAGVKAGLDKVPVTQRST